MPSAVRGRVTINQHAGRISNSSPHAIGQGTQEQDNLVCAGPGELQCRLGNRIITIANAAATAASDVIAMGVVRHPASDWLIYETLSGDIRVCRGVA